MANILITGGTGSLGLSLISMMPNDSVISISRNEFLISKAREMFPHVKFVLGDIRDISSVESYFKNIDIVIHSAAIKHVDNGELFSSEIIKTNILGTQNIIDLSIKNNVSQFIFISSDKSAYVDNLYGATKLTGERIVLSKSIKSKTIRFGNLIGSNGSVFDIWKNSKNAINLTDKSMTRFFISKQDASNFIISCINNELLNNKVIVPKLKSIKMEDIANMFSNELKIPVKVAGMRPGEKIKEFLMTSEEFAHSSDHGDFWTLSHNNINNGDISQIDSSLSTKWDVDDLFNMI